MNPEKQKILDAIQALESQRAILGDTVVDAALASMKQSLSQLENVELTAKAVSATPMEGERKLVTIMFADFSNFTSMSERMDAEDVRAVMNDCFSLLVPIVEQYGGVVDKFIGDEIMALFGAPYAHDNDAECALRAALDMMAALEAFNKRSGTNLGLHFGINTGIVIAGGVGSTERQQYSVIGDPVNLAARLEDASVTGEILVGHSTYTLTSALFEFEERAAISVKGKAKPVPLYRLLSVKTTPQLQRGIKGLNSEMVGRDAPFQLILNALHDLKKNQGQVMALIAEPGLGKSRMLSELKKTASYTHWIEGRGLSFAQNISYGVVKNMLDNALNIPSHVTTEAVGQTLYNQLIALDAAQADSLYPYLARLRDIALDNETDVFLRSIVPDVMQERMRQALGAFLILKSKLQPIVLVWEDLHWADTSSLQLIEYLFEIIKDKPILMLLAYRPQEGLIQEFHPRWVEAYQIYQVITLQPLSESDSHKLIQNLLNIKNLSHKTHAVLLQKAEGNPFYLEELIRALLDSGHLVWEEDGIQLRGDVDEIHIPNTLQGVIEARIDRLQSEEKITLQTASVIGRIFGKQVLEYLIENQKRAVSLNPALSNLQDKELIRQQILYEYIFKHAVTQDVTYNSLLLARRRELHQYAAEAIESLFNNQKEDLAHVLAWHYQRAQNHEKAVLYLVQAADKSRITFSYHEAKNYYSEALKELDYVQDNRWEQKETILEKLGEVLVTVLQLDEARKAYADAQIVVPDSEIIIKARLNRKIGESFAPQRRPDQELVHFNLAIDALGDENEKELLLWQQEWLEIHLARAWSFYWLNQVANMRQTLETIQTVCEQVGTVRQQAIWYGRWMLHIARATQFDISQDQLWYIEKAIELSKKAQDYKLITFHLGTSGMVNLYAGNLEKAETILFEAIDLGNKIGDIQSQVICLQFLNLYFIKTNNIEGVRKYVVVMEEKTKSKLPFYMFSVKGLYCWLALKSGDFQEAETLGLEALKIHNNAPAPNAYIHWFLAVIYINQKRYAEAIPQLKDILLPYQIKTNRKVVDSLQNIFDLWHNNKHEYLDSALKELLELAQQYNYF